MNNIKNIPELRFPEFSGDWEVKKLGEVGNFIGGGTPSSENESYWDGNIPWISSSDIKENEIKNVDVTRFITEEAVEKSATKLIPANSVLIVSRVGVGKVAVNDFSLCTSQDFASLIVKKGNPIFIAYNYLSNANYFKSLCQGTSIKGITGEDLKKSKLALPTLPEQQKIANFLTAIDEKINLLTRKHTALQAYKKGVMQQIFNQTIRFKKEDGGAFGDWEVVKLGKLTYKVGKRNKNSVQYPIYSINNKEGFTPQSEQFDGLSSTERGYDISLYKIVGKQTFAYNPARINVGSIGYSKDLENVIVSSLYVCFKTTEELNDDYFIHFLETRTFNVSVRRFSEGGVRSYLFYENFSSIKIPLPSLEEQQKIANFLTSLDKKIGEVSEQLEGVQAYKRGLLQRMFV